MKNDYEIRGDVTAIFLRRRDGSILETLVDTEDLPKANEFSGSWCAEYKKDIDSYYVIGVKDYKSFRLHRWLMNPPHDKQVDHINGNGLDNRRKINLRMASPGENMQNRKRKDKKTISGFENITKCSKTGNWSAHIQINGKCIWLGNYRDIEEAKLIVVNARATLMPFSREARDVGLKKIDISSQLQRKKLPVDNTSGHVGVYMDKRYGTWYAQIKHEGQRYNLGTFKTKEKAVNARIEMEQKLKKIMEA